MLTIRKIPGACQSCRFQLLSLFEHGFANQAVSRPSNLRSVKITSRTSYPHRAGDYRSFSTIRALREENKEDTQESGQPVTSDIEAVVRQARQTFGETLPKDYLSTEEYVLYERLYGPPLRETKADDLEYVPGSEEGEEPVRNVLLREIAEGEYEEVEFDREAGYPVADAQEADPGRLSELDQSAIPVEDYESSEDTVEVAQDIELSAESQDDRIHIQFQGQNQREIDAMARLQKDMDAALAQPVQEEEEIDEEFEKYEEEFNENEEEYEEDERDGDANSDSIRTHPHTITGRFGTNPSTLRLPVDTLVAPISELLERTNIKHLRDAAERAFGGPGLPHSSMTRMGKVPPPQQHIGLDASQHRMTELEADAYLAGVLPGTYASVMSTLVEVRRRLGSQWIRDLIFREGGEGPRLLDAGAGGVGAIAWREIIQAEWETLVEEGMVEGKHAPFGKTTVLAGSATLKQRLSRFIGDTTFLPRLPDYVHASNSEARLDGSPAYGRKTYDVIVAPHTLFPLKEDFRRRNMVKNLWSLLDPNGGVLILIEKGMPRGFEAIADARSLLLDSHISSPGKESTANETQSKETDKSRLKKEEGMIIAPCTNHEKCPMYPVPGLSTGRKDFCHFNQRFTRPQFLQNVLKAGSRNHEDVRFSYIAVRRGVDGRNAVEPIMQGEDATTQAFNGYESHDLPGSDVPVDADNIKFNALALPRIILPSIKRRGHVTMDLCTPSGQLERWTIPRSFSKSAHRDARKSKWGDLWALGAKTRGSREPRLGRLGGTTKGIRDGKMGKGGKKVRRNEFEIVMGHEGMEGIREAQSSAKFVKREKRTKGGRIWKEAKPIGEKDI